MYPSVPFLVSHISHSCSSVPQCTLCSFPHFTFVLQCTLVYPFQFPTFHIRTLVYPSVPFLVSHFQFPTFHIRTLVYPSVPFLVSHISHSYSSVPQCTLSSFPHFTFVLQCTRVYPFQFTTFHIRTLVYPSIPFLVSHSSYSYSSVPQCTISSFPHFKFVLQCTLVYPFQYPTLHIHALVYPSVPFLVSHISHSCSSVPQCTLCSFPHFTFVLQCTLVYPFQFPTFHIRTLVYPSIPFLVSHISHSYSSLPQCTLSSFPLLVSHISHSYSRVPQCTLSSFPHFTFVLQCTLVYPFQFPTFHIRTLVYPSVPFLVSHISHSYSSVPQSTLSSFPHFTFVLQCTLVYPFQFPTFHIRTLVYPSIPFLVSHISHSYSSVPQCTHSSFPHFTFVLQCTLVYAFQFPTFHIRTLVYPSVPFLVSHISYSYSSVPQYTLSSFPHFTFILVYSSVPFVVSHISRSYSSVPQCTLSSFPHFTFVLQCTLVYPFQLPTFHIRTLVYPSVPFLVSHISHSFSSVPQCTLSSFPHFKFVLQCTLVYPFQFPTLHIQALVYPSVPFLVSHISHSCSSVPQCTLCSFPHFTFVLWCTLVYPFQFPTFHIRTLVYPSIPFLVSHISHSYSNLPQCTLSSFPLLVSHISHSYSRVPQCTLSSFPHFTFVLQCTLVYPFQFPTFHIRTLVYPSVPFLASHISHSYSSVPQCTLSSFPHFTFVLQCTLVYPFQFPTSSFPHFTFLLSCTLVYPFQFPTFHICTLVYPSIPFLVSYISHSYSSVPQCTLSSFPHFIFVLQCTLVYPFWFPTFHIHTRVSQCTLRSFPHFTFILQCTLVYPFQFPTFHIRTLVYPSVPFLVSHISHSYSSVPQYTLSSFPHFIFVLQCTLVYPSQFPTFHIRTRVSQCTLPSFPHFTFVLQCSLVYPFQFPTFHIRTLLYPSVPFLVSHISHSYSSVPQCTHSSFPHFTFVLQCTLEYPFQFPTFHIRTLVYPSVPFLVSHISNSYSSVPQCTHSSFPHFTFRLQCTLVYPFQFPTFHIHALVYPSVPFVVSHISHSYSGVPQCTLSSFPHFTFVLQCTLVYPFQFPTFHIRTLIYPSVPFLVSHFQFPTFHIRTLVYPSVPFLVSHISHSYSSVPQYTLSSFPHFTFVLQCTLVYPFQLPTFHIRTLVYPSVPFPVSHISHSYSSVPQCTLSSFPLLVSHISHSYSRVPQCTLFRFPHFTFVLQCTLVYPFQFPTFHIRTLVYPSVPFLVSHISYLYSSVPQYTLSSFPHFTFILVYPSVPFVVSHISRSYSSVPQCTHSSFPHFTFVLQCTLVYPFQFPTFHIRTLVYPSIPFLVSHISYSYSSVPQYTLPSFPHFTFVLVYPSVPFLVSHISHSYSSVPQCTLSSFPHFTFVLYCTLVYPFQFPTFHIRPLVYPSVPFLVSHISPSYSSVPQSTLSSFPHFTFVLQCTLVYPFQFPTFHIRTLVYPSVPFLVSHISYLYSSVPQYTLSSFPRFTFILVYPSVPFVVSHISRSYSSVPQCTHSSFPHFTFVLQCTLVYPFQLPTFHIRTLVYPSVPFLVSHISYSYSNVPQYTLSRFPHFTFILVYPSVPFLVSHISHSYSSVPQCTLSSFPHFTFVLQCTRVYPFQFTTFHIRTLVYPSIPFLVSHSSYSYSSVPQCTISSFPHFKFVLQCTLVYPFQYPTLHIHALVYPSVPFLVSHISHSCSSVPQCTLCSFPHFTFVLQCTLVYPFQFPTFHIRTLVYPSIPFLVSHISHSYSSLPQCTLSSFPLLVSHISHSYSRVPQCTLSSFPHFTFVLQCTLVYPFQFPTFHIRTLVYPSVPFLVSHISHSYSSVPQSTLSSFPHFTFVLQCTLVYPFQFPTFHIRTLVYPSIPFLVSHISHSYSSVPQCTHSSLPHFTFVLQCTLVYAFQFPTFHIRTLVYPSVPFLVSHISHSYSSVPQCTLSSFPHFTFVLQCTLVYPFQFPTFHIRTLVYPSVPFLVSHISHSYSSVPQYTLSSFPHFTFVLQCTLVYPFQFATFHIRTLVYPSVRFLVSHISHSYSSVPQCTLSSFPHFTFVLQCTLVYPFQLPPFTFVLQCTLVYPFQFPTFHIRTLVYPSVPFLVSHISHSYSSVPQCTLSSFPHFTFVLQCTRVYPFQFTTFHIRTLVYPSIPFLVSHSSYSYSSVPQCTISSFPHFKFVLQCTLVYPFQYPTLHIHVLVYPSVPFLVSHISHSCSSVPQCTLCSFPHFTFVLQCTLVYPFQFPTFHIRTLVYPSIPFLVSHISHSYSSLPQCTLSSFPLLVSHISHSYSRVPQCTLSSFPHFTFVLQCTLVYPFQFPTFHIRTLVYPSVPFLVSHISHSYSSVPQSTLSSFPHFTFVLQCTLVYPFQFPTFHIRTLVYPSIPFLVSHISHSYSSVPQCTHSSLPHFTFVLQCTLVYAFQFPTFHIRTLVYPSVPFLVSHISHSYSSVPQYTLSSFPPFTFVLQCTPVYPFQFPTFHIRTLVYPSVPFLVSHISNSYSSVPQCTLSSFPPFTFVLQCTLVYPFQFPTFHIRTLVYPSVPFLVSHISNSYSSVPQCTHSSFPHFTFRLQCTLVYPFQFPTFHIHALVYPSVPFVVSHISHSYSGVPQCTLSSFPHFTFVLQCTLVYPFQFPTFHIRTLIYPSVPFLVSHFQFPTFHIRTLVYPSVPFLVSHISHSYSSVPQYTLSSFPHFTFVLQCTLVYPFQLPTFHIRTLVYPSVPFPVSHISHSYSSVPQCTLSSFPLLVSHISHSYSRVPQCTLFRFPHFTFVLQCTLVYPFQFPTSHIRTLVYPSIPLLVFHISYSYSSTLVYPFQFPTFHIRNRVSQCTIPSFPHFTFVLQCTLVYPFQFPTFHIRTLVYPSVPFLVSHISHSYSSVPQCTLSSFPHFTFVLQCTVVYPFQFPTFHIRTLVYPSVPFLVSHISHSYSSVPQYTLSSFPHFTFFLQCTLVYPLQFPTFHIRTLVYPSVPFLVSHFQFPTFHIRTLVYPSVPFLVSHISHSYSCTLVYPSQFPTFHIRTLVYPSVPFLVSHISHS